MSKKETRDEDKPAKPVEESLFKFIGELEEPKYRLEETAVGGSLALAIFVELPRIESMRALHLDVTDKQLQVRMCLMSWCHDDILSCKKNCDFYIR